MDWHGLFWAYHIAMFIIAVVCLILLVKIYRWWR